MPRGKKRRVHVSIGRINIINVIRDVVHQRGDAAVAVNEIDAAGVGGDVINAKANAKRRKRGARKISGTATKAITHGGAVIASIGAMVAASGLAHALGWA